MPPLRCKPIVTGALARTSSIPTKGLPIHDVETLSRSNRAFLEARTIKCTDGFAATGPQLTPVSAEATAC